ncbi:MAG: alpha/beta hydrolase [Candidatus Omnitrophica bacterium]|nr:alpha/beta hydrolase [Candidatus Omnitrophota bacterium]MBU4488880.1 alpha/beta hydrolase [Candidatus Omnitrophota bacterium]MCG2705468.1 alpha/beta hydrolase [Candidatus Omnitrophota bacterium]
MKKIYLYLAIITIMSVLLLVLSFFYIDRQGRQTFLYAIYYDNVPSGYEKIDRYLIENKLIYKSLVEFPRSMLSRKKTQKIRFSANGKEFIDYNEEITENGAKSTAYIRNLGDAVSFLGISNAAFTCLDRMSVRGNFTIFNKKAVVTYAPLARRYNFKKRGEQFFNTMAIISPDLPPVPAVVSITAIGKDIITINDKKVKCENLIFELENGDLASVWITSAFRNILMIKIPKCGFKAVLSVSRESIPVEEYVNESDLYAEKELVFKSGDISLNGALSVPTAKKEPYPALLLIWDKGPSDKNALGIFTDIASILARNGYCVLRFDKRGVGKSQGFFSTYDQAEEIEDLKSAVQFLKSLPEVDKDRIGVLGYGEGGFYAAYLAGAISDIRVCVFLAAGATMDPLKNNAKKITDWIKNNIGDNPQYIESAVKALSQTKEISMGQGDWTTIEASSVFTKKVKTYGSYDMLEVLKEVKAPVLIIHGKNDRINLPEESKEIESALSKSGNNSVTSTYFNDLDHLLGQMVKTGNIKEHIEVAPAVTQTILSWLDENLTTPKIADTEPLGSATNATTE